MPPTGPPVTRPRGGRRHAREVAFRVVYQAERCGDGYEQAWSGARAEERLNDDQRELVDDVVRTLAERAGEVDDHIRRAAEHWQLERLAATDRSVLRGAVAELMGRPGSPARVVIDEAIEIARKFGDDASGRFVNGVLDRIARELRPGEL
jgi:transcription antitermination protein NusB